MKHPLMETIKANLNNDKLNDKVFRDFVKTVVEAYDEVNAGEHKETCSRCDNLVYCKKLRK